MTKNIPKAELHCHFESVATTAMTKSFAKRNGMTLPDGMFNEKGELAWSNFSEFLTAFDLASSCIQTTRDYQELAYEYMAACAREGAIYIEAFASPGHTEQYGIDYTPHIDAIAYGFEKAEHEFGITGRLVVNLVRHRGPEVALNLAKKIVAQPHPYVVGVGLAGNEAVHRPIDFKPAFDLVSEAGLGCTAHAGEICGPQSVRDTLKDLPVTRLGHGVRSVEDPELVAEIIERGITLEVCPSSNIALNVYDSYADHPLPQLLEAGCKITLGSDDPPFFKTTIGAEYERAASEMGMSDAQLLSFTKTAIDNSFADPATKTKLHAALH